MEKTVTAVRWCSTEGRCSILLISLRNGVASFFGDASKAERCSASPPIDLMIPVDVLLEKRPRHRQLRQKSADFDVHSEFPVLRHSLGSMPVVLP